MIEKSIQEIRERGEEDLEKIIIKNILNICNKNSEINKDFEAVSGNSDDCESKRKNSRISSMIEKINEAIDVNFVEEISSIKSDLLAKEYIISLFYWG